MKVRFTARLVPVLIVGLTLSAQAQTIRPGTNRPGATQPGTTLPGTPLPGTIQPGTNRANPQQPTLGPAYTPGYGIPGMAPNSRNYPGPSVRPTPYPYGYPYPVYGGVVPLIVPNVQGGSTQPDIFSNPNGTAGTRPAPGGTPNNIRVNPPKRAAVIQGLAPGAVTNGAVTNTPRNIAGGTSGPVAGGVIGGATGGATTTPIAGLSNQFNAVRGSFNNFQLFTPDWNSSHPHAWQANGLTTPFTPTAWNGLAGFVGVTGTPVYFDYGNNITFANNQVYYGQNPVASNEQYYRQAKMVAEKGRSQGSVNSQWMPLGVFAVISDQQTQVDKLFQIAVDRNGVVRGNYHDALTDQSQPISGGFDLKSQRAAWMLSGNDNVVIETGAYNLTQSQFPIVVYNGQGRVETRYLVRLEAPQANRPPR